MAIRERLSGNEAVAYAIKQINPDVMRHFQLPRQRKFLNMWRPILPMGKWIQNLFM